MTAQPLAQPLAQYQREMMVGAFLDITTDQWKAWVTATGDDAIPTDLHRHVVAIMLGLSRTDGHTYQDYLQALCMLSDESLVWLVRQAGTSPL
jgi:hypothetical protein